MIFEIEMGSELYLHVLDLRYVAFLSGSVRGRHEVNGRLEYDSCHFALAQDEKLIAMSA